MCQFHLLLFFFFLLPELALSCVWTRSAFDLVRRPALWPILPRRLSLSSGSAVGALSIQLRVHSGRPGERNTTPLSHLADVPVLLYSLPHFFPPSSLSSSLAQYLTHVLYKWASGECFCMCAVQTRGPFYCYVCGREQQGEEERDGNEAGD